MANGYGGLSGMFQNALRGGQQSMNMNNMGGQWGNALSRFMQGNYGAPQPMPRPAVQPAVQQPRQQAKPLAERSVAERTSTGGLPSGWERVRSPSGNSVLYRNGDQQFVRSNGNWYSVDGASNVGSNYTALKGKPQVFR